MTLSAIALLREATPPGYPFRAMVRREDGRSAQLKEKVRLMKLLKIAALFLLSISTHAVLAGRSSLTVRPNSTSLRPRASRYGSISAQTVALLAQRKSL